MKPLRFCVGTFLFLLAALLLFGGVLVLSAREPFRTPLAKLTASTGYTDDATLDVEYHLANVQTEDGATKLIVGDSVCWQVFNPFEFCNTEYRIDGCNRALTVAGQYLLIEQFLQHHPDATDVYLVLGPASFSAGYDTTYGYQYAALPFAKAGLLGGLDDETRAELCSAYGAPFVSRLFAAWVDASPLGRKLYLNALQALRREAGGGALIPLAARNLRNIEALCAERGVAFHLLCDPIPDSEASLSALSALEEAFREQGLYDRYASYFTQAPIYPASMFQADGIHFD
ncbi:MAG: hypothetical protein ACI4OI_02625, partial [Gemmiger sp.]